MAPNKLDARIPIRKQKCITLQTEKKEIETFSLLIIALETEKQKRKQKIDHHINIRHGSIFSCGVVLHFFLPELACFFP